MVNVFWFPISVSVASQRAKIGAFLTNVRASLGTGNNYVVRTAGRELDDVTGALTGAWAEPTGQSGLGSGAGTQCPDAAQLLFRWNTATIVGSRFLQGRTYIPGLVTAGITGGNVSAVTKATLDGYAATFVSGSTGPGVWHRPVLGAGGAFFPAITGNVWSELAVLRRRRQ